MTRATLARILGDLESRGLTRQNAKTYEASPAGQALIEVFLPAVETAAALDSLGDLVAWFPFGDMGFDVRHLHNDCVVQPTKTDATRTVNRSLDLIDMPENV